MLFQERLGTPIRRARPIHPPDLNRGIDFEFAFDEDGTTRRVWVTVKSRVRVHDVSTYRALAERVSHARPDVLPLLVAPRLGARVRDALRTAAINHADLSGTLFVRAPGLWVDLDGRGTAYRGSGQFDDPDHSGGTINPFADRTSLILRVLLANPDASHRVTQLAAATHVTKGWVSQVCVALVGRGYAEETPTGYRLRDPLHVLHDWSQLYRWRMNRVQSFMAPFDGAELLERLSGGARATLANVALTLHAGAAFIAPHVSGHDQVHLYVAPKDRAGFDLWTRDHLYVEPVASGGNLQLVAPHYARSAFFGIADVGGAGRRPAPVPVVSPVQLYLDLAHYSVRGPEAAAHLARTVLAPQFAVSPTHVTRIG